jgi:hypothetical protein
MWAKISMRTELLRFSKFFEQQALKDRNRIKTLRHIKDYSNLIKDNLKNGKYFTGYRKGVVTMLIPAGNLKATYGPARDCELFAQYKSRVEGEEPRLYIRGVPQSATAGHCQVIFYHSDVLLEDESDQMEIEMLNIFSWNIVAVNCGAGEKPAPIHPDTLMHNHFHTSGGTNTGMDPQAFESAMRESFIYWKDVVFYE